MKRSPLKRKPFKVKKTSQKTLCNKADKLWGLAVRQRDKDTCQCCGKPGNQPHHIFTRSIKHMRHDISNGITLCSYCHTLGTHSAHKGPEAFRDFLLKHIGETYFALKWDAQRNVKPDYAEAISHLENILQK